MNRPTASVDNIFPALSKVGLLGKDNVKIKDKIATDKLIASLIEGGFDNLQFIVDFDYTLSKGHFDGEANQSSWGVLDNSEHVPAFYRSESEKLFQKYYPIEIHASMTEAEKIPHIRIWYNQIRDLLIRCHLRKEFISDMVRKSKLQLRIDTDKLFRTMKEEDVPILIFSAGMGDILEELLRLFDVYSDNVKVVSNFFKYDDKGVMIDFVGEQIHMFNKNENAIHSSDYFGTLEKRRNIILMGDSLGDTKMSVGMPNPNNVLKIGFLNVKIQERLDSYMDAYDVVLIKDQTMDLANMIVANMTRRKTS